MCFEGMSHANLTTSPHWEGGCHWKEKSQPFARQVGCFLMIFTVWQALVILISRGLLIPGMKCSIFLVVTNVDQCQEHPNDVQMLHPSHSSKHSASGHPHSWLATSGLEPSQSSTTAWFDRGGTVELRAVSGWETQIFILKISENHLYTGGWNAEFLANSRSISSAVGFFAAPSGFTPYNAIQAWGVIALDGVGWCRPWAGLWTVNHRNLLKPPAATKQNGLIRPWITLGRLQIHHQIKRNWGTTRHQRSS